MWRVTADGEESGTFLKLAGSGGLQVWHACGVIEGSWAVGPTRFLSTVTMSPDSCRELAGQMSMVPWLYAATAYKPDGDGWDLVDPSGAVTATLRHEGLPAADANRLPGEEQAPVADDAARSWLGDAAPLPAGLQAATLDELIGRWIQAGAPSTTSPWVQLTGNGMWQGSGCTRMGGRWGIDVDGQFVIPSGGAMTAIGCDGGPLPGLLVTARRAALSSNGDLLLFDNEGTQVAQLTRDDPTSASSSPGATSEPSQGPTAPTGTVGSTAPVGPPDATSVAACTSGGLSVSLGTGGGAALGTAYVDLLLTNTSTHPCTLSGWPGVSFVGDGNGTQIGAAAGRDWMFGPVTVTLAPGESAHEKLGIANAGNYSTSSCDPVTPDGFRVYPPDETHALFLPTTQFTACRNASDGLLTVTALQPGAS